MLEWIPNFIEALETDTTLPEIFNLAAAHAQKTLSTDGLNNRVLLAFRADNPSIQKLFQSFNKLEYLKGLEVFEISPGLEILPDIMVYPRNIFGSNIVMITVPMFKDDNILPPGRLISEVDRIEHPVLRNFKNCEALSEGVRQWALRKLLKEKLISEDTAKTAGYNANNPDLLLLLKQQLAHPVIPNQSSI